MRSRHKICTFHPWAIKPPAQVFEGKKWRHDRKSILIKKINKSGRKGAWHACFTNHKTWHFLITAHSLFTTHTRAHFKFSHCTSQVVLLILTYWLVSAECSLKAYINCLLLLHLSNTVCILWTSSSYEPSADLVTQFQAFVCVRVPSSSLRQCNVQKRHILHAARNACLSKEPHTTPCNKVYCILQHILNAKTSSLKNFKKDIVQAA